MMAAPTGATKAVVPLIEFEDSLDIGIAFQPEGVALAPAAVGRVKIFAMAMTVSLHPPLRVAHLATPLELIGTRGETIWPGQVMIRAASGIVHCELLDKGKEKVPTRKLAPPAPAGQATATPALAFVAIVGDYEVIGCS